CAYSTLFPYPTFFRATLMTTGTIHMSERPGNDPEPPEEQPGGEMTLIEHLLELRMRVTWMAIAVVVGMAVFFIPAFGFRVIEYRSEEHTSELQSRENL